MPLACPDQPTEKCMLADWFLPIQSPAPLVCIASVWKRPPCRVQTLPWENIWASEEVIPWRRPWISCSGSDTPTAACVSTEISSFSRCRSLILEDGAAGLKFELIFITGVSRRENPKKEKRKKKACRGRLILSVIDLAALRSRIPPWFPVLVQLLRRWLSHQLHKVTSNQLWQEKPWNLI